MRGLLSLLSSGILAFTVLTAGSLAAVPSVSAATIASTTTCSNGLDNTGGLGAICEVTVVNTITATGGSATVTVRECHGPAGDPEAACTTETTVLGAPVTVVQQCNDATNGGGGTLRCSVQVTNNFVGLSPTVTAVTVNQCVGSGDGQTTGCDPFPATTTGATITQCNGSANGGTLVGLTCTATGTESAALAVTINQCNDSTNGGGGLVICIANIDSNIIAPTPTPTPTLAPASTATPFQPTVQLTQPPTDTGSNVNSRSTPAGVPWGLFAVLCLSSAILAATRIRSRRTRASRATDQVAGSGRP